MWEKKCLRIICSFWFYRLDVRLSAGLFDCVHVLGLQLEAVGTLNQIKSEPDCELLSLKAVDLY